MSNLLIAVAVWCGNPVPTVNGWTPHFHAEVVAPVPAVAKCRQIILACLAPKIKQFSDSVLAERHEILECFK